jgi:hypothetical protein
MDPVYHDTNDKIANQMTEFAILAPAYVTQRPDRSHETQQDRAANSDFR